MEVKPVEVYAEDSNYGVVRMPGRNYPGAVIQGDSLKILWGTAREVVEGVRAGRLDDEDFLVAVEELHNALLGRLLHYQEVLRREGFDLPHVWAVTAEHVRLTQEAEDD
ncbi:MAG: hypothetical protein U0804_12520 [Gemmataceae bacterium]